MPPDGESGPSVDESPAHTVAAVAARATQLADPNEPPGLGDFTGLYLASVAPDDLAARDPDRVAAAVYSHWQLAREREPGCPLVRVSTPSDGVTAHSVVEVVCDDMAFLVDSVTMEIERNGFGIHFLLHPIIGVRREGSYLADVCAPGSRNTSRDRSVTESYIRVEIDRETDPGVLDRLRDEILRILNDVYAANADWSAMRDAARTVSDHLRLNPPPVGASDAAEAISLLEWMAADYFTFLGAAEYDLIGQRGEERLVARADSELGILRDRGDRTGGNSFSRLPADVRALAYEPKLLTLTKANSKSTVHRATYLDYVGIKRFTADGAVDGEWRFLGLWTWGAYNARVGDVPVVRRKVALVLERAAYPERSHDARDLAQILETLPRDELLAMSVDELFDLATGILHLQHRKRTKLFVRRDQFRRFVSCLVFLPRDCYNTPTREAITEILVEAFAALSHEFDARVSESRLARLHFVLRTDPSDRRRVDVDEVEAAVIRATRSWADDLRDALMTRHGEEHGLDMHRAWQASFPAGFRADYTAADALPVISEVSSLGDPPSSKVRLSPPAPTSAGDLDFTVFVRGEPPMLSEILPTLGNMGVEVVDEHPYLLAPPGAGTVMVQRFGLRAPRTGGDASAHRNFEECFRAVQDGRAEDDGLNRLVLSAGLTWREVGVLRAYSRYLRQIGARFAQGDIADAVCAHPDLARTLVELHRARFDPSVAPDQRGATQDSAVDDMLGALESVESLDEDRILRSLLALVLATVRTNWFARPDAPAHAIKLDPALVPELPEPRPAREIWVYSPAVEGVHLRSDSIARGGIRWSDRPTDFRTEVLGLMKAQRVKNTVIVPAGAKGGFVVKPAGTAGGRPTPDEVVVAYRAYIEALLDVTDNRVRGSVEVPDGIVRYDGDDTYIVAAADKGTATLSDVANEISRARNFWLGDAFASGGSVGYDHKKMAITAKGAWESVRRHFRELGVDADHDQISLVGIGDMSGDVFGNGVLLSHELKLVAAFDHRHVFVDPNPDPMRSYEERKRLFHEPRSSWADYDRSAISAGGGVYSRLAKAVPVSAEVRERLGIADAVTQLTPTEMIRAVLCAPVDLLWNGGVGTFVKATDEHHSDVGDKGNDLVRVNANELRCRVVAEGGNLGLTSRARTEFAQHGGLVNTDFVDNSGGVDASDHEVNIKIVLDAAVHQGGLDANERDELFVAMTDDVASLVLRTNYRQNRALGNARAQAYDMADVHARYIRELEHRGQLDRTIECLPDDEALTERRHAGQGLTSPELAVLLSYTKIALDTELRESDLPDDPDFVDELEGYFPQAMRERFSAEINDHPLRRGIVSTQVVNRLVNLAGLSFVFRMQEETGASVPDVVRAHRAAREIFDVSNLWQRIAALDNVVDAEVQTAMYLESRKTAERASRWLLRHRRRPLPVRSTLDFFGPGVRSLTSRLRSLANEGEQARIDDHSAQLAGAGVPSDLADHMAILETLVGALDIVDLSLRAGLDVERVAAVYFELGERLHLDWLTGRVLELPRDDRWHSLARTALRDDASAVHRELTSEVLAFTAVLRDATEACSKWLESNAALAERTLRVLNEIRNQDARDLHTLTVALRELRNLAQPS